MSSNEMGRQRTGKEIREATESERSFDEVTPLLMEKRRVNKNDPREIFEQLIGRPAHTFDTSLPR